MGRFLLSFVFSLFSPWGRGRSRRGSAWAIIGFAAWLSLLSAPLAPSLRAASIKGRQHKRPPLALIVDWQPLRSYASDLVRGRAELKRAVRAHDQRRYAAACLSLERLRARLITRASHLFYGPVRTGADVEGMDRFMGRYVRGKAPLLQLAGEVLVPASGLRSLAVDACVRARRPELAERFVAQAAGAEREARLRLALAVVRLQRGAPASTLVWLVGERGGGVGASLLRALASRGEARRRALRVARGLAADPRRRALLRSFSTWIEREDP